MTYYDNEVFKELLSRRLEELLDELVQDKIKLQEDVYHNIVGEIYDDVDASFADLVADLNQAKLDRDIEELYDVDKALTSIQSRNYGICIDCEEMINFNRLKAHPTAKRCLACQDKYELRHQSIMSSL